MGVGWGGGAGLGGWWCVGRLAGRERRRFLVFVGGVRAGCCGRQTLDGVLSAACDEFDSAEPGECGGESVRPWPVFGEVEGVVTR